MGDELSQVLLANGFFSALGTTENFGGDWPIVGRGRPFSTDANNGVTVVYDEQGRPWIKTALITPSVISALEGFPLRRGAFVPHSNDGGKFMRIVAKL